MPMLRIHWLHGTFPLVHLQTMYRRLAPFFDVEPVKLLRYSKWGYTDAYQLCEGVYVLASPGQDDAYGRPVINARTDACLKIEGRACDRLTGEQFYELISDLRPPEMFTFAKNQILPAEEFWFRCARIDCAFDDEAWIIKPERLWSDYAFPKLFSGAKIRTSAFGGNSMPADCNGSHDGASVQFGKRGQSGSGVSLKVYDKWAESEGEINAVRWEARYESDKAIDAFLYLLCASSYSEFAKRISALVVSQYSFFVADSVDQKNRDRRVEAPFWQQLKAVLGDGITFPRFTKRTGRTYRRTY